MTERWNAGRLKRLLADVDDDAAVYLSFDESPTGRGYVLTDAGHEQYGTAQNFVWLGCGGPDPHADEVDVTGMTPEEIAALSEQEGS